MKKFFRYVVLLLMLIVMIVPLFGLEDVHAATDYTNAYTYFLNKLFSVGTPTT